ncbi:MAG: helix-turn-helix domain-containing protein [Clostridia bacterium]|nr:helix-turn-helix domain-containing protein [Clostridia bacterium]
MDVKLLTADRFVDGRIGISYRYVYSDTEYFRPHYHDYYELFVLLDGNAIHLINGKEILLKKGASVFIRPSDTHDYRCIDGTPFSMLNLTFTAETANALFSYLGNSPAVTRLLRNSMPPTVTLTDADFAWFNAHMTSIRAISPDHTEELRTTLRVLLFRFLTRYYLQLPGEDADEKEMPAWLSSLCNEMRKNQNFVYGSARMLELSDRSREHLSRSLKKYTGMTVSEFVNDLRLTFVANMLKNSNHSISHILFESGFNNVSWASELFRQKYGMTMREFRKR